MNYLVFGRTVGQRHTDGRKKSIEYLRRLQHHHHHYPYSIPDDLWVRLPVYGGGGHLLLGGKGQRVQNHRREPEQVRTLGLSEEILPVSKKKY